VHAFRCAVFPFKLGWRLAWRDAMGLSQAGVSAVIAAGDAVTVVNTSDRFAADVENFKR